MLVTCCCAVATSQYKGADLKKALRRNIDDLARTKALQVLFKSTCISHLALCIAKFSSYLYQVLGFSMAAHCKDCGAFAVSDAHLSSNRQLPVHWQQDLDCRSIGYGGFRASATCGNLTGSWRR